MCLQPLTIRNPTKRIYKRGGQPLLLKVPCNKCAECLSTKRSEWAFRSQQEVKRTLALGGYVYYDTLTYAPAHLPRISDFVDIRKYGIKNFSCFNHVHFKLFLKLLRRQLHAKYGVKKDAFRYFLTSEYGMDDRFTHRPHYHILFYVTCGIHPYTFSRLVAKCWRYGRTDGLPYKTKKYVSDNIFGVNVGFGNNNTFDVVERVCSYISAYISKNSTFEDKLQKRINVLRWKIDDKEYVNKLQRNIDMFHRQSHGYGDYYLSHLGDIEHDALLRCKVIAEDSKKVVKEYALPLYYRRKLYYNLCYRIDKDKKRHYYWQLHEYGIKATTEIKLKQLDEKRNACYDDIYNMTDEQIERLDKLLAGRSFNDYLIYMSFYQGRMRDNNSYDIHNLRCQRELTDTEYNLHDWINLINDSSQVNSLDINEYYPVDDKVNISPYNKKCLGYDYIDSDTYMSVDIEQLIKHTTFNENSCLDFKDFDKITTLFAWSTKEKRVKQQKTFDYKEDFKERLKLLQLC